MIEQRKIQKEILGENAVNEKSTQQEYEIDLLDLAKAMWAHIVAIVLTAVVCAGLAFGYTKLLITPTYKAKAP